MRSNLWDRIIRSWTLCGLMIVIAVVVFIQTLINVKYRTYLIGEFYLVQQNDG